MQWDYLRLGAVRCTVDYGAWCLVLLPRGYLQLNTAVYPRVTRVLWSRRLIYHVIHVIMHKSMPLVHVTCLHDIFTGIPVFRFLSVFRLCSLNTSKIEFENFTFNAQFT